MNRKDEDAPQVYAIRKDPSGAWALSRRSLFAAAAAAAASPNARAGACKERPNADDAGPLAITPDGRILVSRNKLWSLPDGSLLKTLETKEFGTEVYGLAISPDGNLLVSAGGDYKNAGAWGGSIRLFSLPDGVLLKRIGWTGGGITSPAISPDGRLLVTVGSYLDLWSLPDGTLLKTLTEGYGCSSAAISPDGQLMVSAHADYGIRLWSLPAGTLLKTLPRQARFDYPLLVAVSPDGRTLLSGSMDGTLELWSLPDGKPLSTNVAHDRIVALAVSPSGRLAITAGSDAAIRLWSLPDGAPLKTITQPWGTGSLAISPDDGLLAAYCGNAIQLWSLPDGKLLPVCLMDPADNPNTFNAICYTKDGVTYTLPEGSSMPTGAVCTCNTVPGAHSGGCAVVYYYPN